MRKLISKSFIMILFIAILVSVSGNAYAAGSYSISSGISTIEEGKTYTVTIKGSGLTGKFNISSSSNVSVDTSSVWIENSSATVKVTAKSSGKATVTATPEEGVADSATGMLLNLGSKTDTVSVNKKSSSSNSKPSSESTSNTTKNSATTTKPTFTSRNQTVYATSQVNVRSSYSTSSSILGSLKKGDSLTRTGIATSRIDGILWSKVTYNGQTAYISSDSLTTIKPEEEKKTEEQKENEQERNTEEQNSSIEEDQISIGLSELLIEGLPLEPEFNTNIYEYKLILDKSDVSELNITAIANKEEAEVEVLGNADLKEGDNIVTILVTSPDENETATYQVTATIPPKASILETIINNKDLYEYIAIGVLTILLLLLIIILIKRKVKNKNANNIEEMYEYKNEYRHEVLPNLKGEELPESLRSDPIVQKEYKDEIINDDIISEENHRIRRKGKHF